MLLSVAVVLLSVLGMMTNLDIGRMKASIKLLETEIAQIKAREKLK